MNEPAIASTTSDNNNNNKNNDKVKELNAAIGKFSDAAVVRTPLADPTQFWKTTHTADLPSPTDVAKHYAPLHLEQQFEELYRVLHPALVDRRDKKNASAFLQGARGTGKSLVLELVLQALQSELGTQTPTRRPFRIVRLNGILVPGSQVTLCVQEILRQLTEQAYHEAERQMAPPPPAVGAVAMPPPMQRNTTVGSESEDFYQVGGCIYLFVYLFMFWTRGTENVGHRVAEKRKKGRK